MTTYMTATFSSAKKNWISKRSSSKKKTGYVRGPELQRYKRLLEGRGQAIPNEKVYWRDTVVSQWPWAGDVVDRTMPPPCPPPTAPKMSTF